jgi:hypothetical protein
VASFSPVFSILEKRTPGTRWIRAWGGPIFGLDALENRTVISPSYQLRYPGCRTTTTPITTTTTTTTTTTATSDNNKH